MLMLFQGKSGRFEKQRSLNSTIKIIKQTDRGKERKWKQEVSKQECTPGKSKHPEPVKAPLCEL